MKLSRIHAIIGLLLVLVPFMGFTREFKYGFMAVAGAVILYFALTSIHIELRKKHRRPHRHDTFVENKPAEPQMETKPAEEANPPAPPATPSSHVAGEPEL